MPLILIWKHWSWLLLPTFGVFLFWLLGYLNLTIFSSISHRRITVMFRTDLSFDIWNYRELCSRFQFYKNTLILNWFLADQPQYCLPFVLMLIFIHFVSLNASFSNMIFLMTSQNYEFLLLFFFFKQKTADNCVFYGQKLQILPLIQGKQLWIKYFFSCVICFPCHD